MNRFVVDRQNLRRNRWQEIAPAPLADGSVRLRIASFALTANNVTYAAFGDAMNYWSFFPTGDDATGCIPVWGFADVAESRCDGIAPGERYYGYWPMADAVDLTPARVGESGFVDAAPHRRELHALYNQYLRCSADPGYDPAQEAEQALLRPLFFTSFLIDDFLADNDDFGARAVVIASASSKTAYGTAFCLKRRDGPAVVGLTSAANRAYTQRLGCYDRVLAYDDLDELDANVPSVYVDMSGHAALRGEVHRRYGDRLTYSCAVGGTHWDELGSGQGLPGPKPTLFFAPAQVAKRRADWGAAALQQRLADAWRAFMVPVTDPRDPWLRVVRGTGRQAVEEVYLALLDGRARPEEGHVLEPSSWQSADR
ncbi:MAG: DUF2855 family protein [Proteobacteria bacterium]|nr:DUF2855 family protein [Pseudomonadota bacterium]